MFGMTGIDIFVSIAGIVLAVLLSAVIASIAYIVKMVLSTNLKVAELQVQHASDLRVMQLQFDQAITDMKEQAIATAKLGSVTERLADRLEDLGRRVWYIETNAAPNQPGGIGSHHYPHLHQRMTDTSAERPEKKEPVPDEG